MPANKAAVHSQMIVLAASVSTGWKEVQIHKTKPNLYNIMKLRVNGQTTVINFVHYC